jgi:hypothetical protein
VRLLGPPGKPLKPVRALLALVALLILCAAAWLAPVAFSSDPFRSDQDVFMFDGYAPLHDSPVKVWFDVPDDTRARADAQVLIVMPGTNRNAADYRADWDAVARERNLVVLVPEFSEEEFPGSAAYNLAGMLDGDGNLMPSNAWAFGIVEALFDDAVQKFGLHADHYALFGHSAGAQFVHRFMQFVPHNRARVAVAANAGWYTVPDNDEPFPYGLKGGPIGEADLGSAFASNLHILLGADDIDSGQDSLRRDDRADEQGTNRLDRGFNYYAKARDVAENRSLPFGWSLSVVPGLAHSHSDMARAAQPILLCGAVRC